MGFAAFYTISWGFEIASKVVADSKYGKIENFLRCHDLGIKAHIPSLEKTHRGSGRQKGIFHREAFSYNRDTDTFTCPAGQILRKRHYHKKRKHYEYKASAESCAHCQLREKCTRSKDGRTLKRHARQDELDLYLNDPLLNPNVMATKEHVGADYGEWRFKIFSLLRCRTYKFSLIIQRASSRAT